MSKSVLVIDTPENCVDCLFCYELDEGIEACCSISDNDKDASLMKKIDCEYGYCQSKPDWCPLKQLPEENSENHYPNKWIDGYANGWNDCLKEIVE